MKQIDDAFTHLNAVIVCGQTGNELWPLVRRKTPRETVVFPGEDESLLASAIRRVKPLTPSPIIFVCPAQIESDIRGGIATSGLLRPDEYEIVIDPEPRGTAFSISLVSAMLRRRDPNAVVLAMPSHLMVDGDERWEQAVARGYRAAETDLVAVIGVPSRESSSPHDYIRPGREIKGVPGVRVIADYLSSPNPAQTTRYINLGHLWSTGILLMRASIALAQLIHVAKHSYDELVMGLDRVAETASFLASIERERWYTPEAREIIESLPEADFADAVLAYSDDTAVIPTSINCSGVTSLADFDDMAMPDSEGNRVMGRGFEIDSTNTTIYNDDRLTVTLGCDNLMVVNTHDSVLVASKDSLDTLGDVLPALVEAGAWEADRSSVSEHSWGRATSIFEGRTSTTRLIELLAGKSIPEYARKRRTERWIVIDGAITCVDGYGTRVAQVGDHLEFKPNERHALLNSSEEAARLLCIEF
ncbi:MAG: sugar phosphate nucleotidyltransferase [Coriobacteriales bacterium]